MIVVAAIYKFTNIIDKLHLKSSVDRILKNSSIKGTVIIADEGLNATIAGTRTAINEFKTFLLGDIRFLGMEYKESLADHCPFKRLKVKIKNEIVTMGCAYTNPCGVHVDAHVWNELLNNPNVTVIDVRNAFEVAMGTFKNALNPNTKAFSDFPEFVRQHLFPSQDKIIAMSCTGGIRCEKASSFLLANGFLEVYQLKGGILQYLHDVPQDKSLWQGNCFVFDDRVALNHQLAPESKLG